MKKAPIGAAPLFWQRAARSARPEAKAMPTRGTLGSDLRITAKAVSWTTRVLHAALLHPENLGHLLSEAHQLSPNVVALQTSGAAIALSAGWLWKSLDEVRRKRRELLVALWKKACNQEIQKLKQATGKTLLPKGIKKSGLFDKSRH